jgi:hypothetical protein
VYCNCRQHCRMPYDRSGGQDSGRQTNGLRRGKSSYKGSAKMVRDIPVPTHDYILRLYLRNLPRRTFRNWAGPTAGQKDSTHGGPTPPPISECRDYLGRGSCRDAGEREGGRTGRDGSWENSLVPVYLPSTSQAPGIGEISKEQTRVER